MTICFRRKTLYGLVCFSGLFLSLQLSSCNKDDGMMEIEKYAIPETGNSIN